MFIKCFHPRFNVSILVIMTITLYIVKLIQQSKKQQHAMGRIKNLIQMSKASNSDCRRLQPPHHTEENESFVEETDPRSRQAPSKPFLPTMTLSPYAKLYVILGSFCTLWLPFCILWPVKSVSPDLIDPIVYTTTYWMGYAQSFINPILLLILNKNYRLRAKVSS